MTQPITILLCALGGEGGGVLAEWLYEAAVHAGHSAQATSIPGVAQRTGATTYYIEIYPDPDSSLAGRRPVFSLNPVPGAIDLLVSSELLETVRQIGAGMASAARTQLISSSARALTVAEKMQMGDGRVADAALLATLQRHSRAVDVLDMTALARANGTAISAVMLGAIAGSGALPMPRAAFEAAIERSGKGVQASLRGFAAAFELIAQRRAQELQVMSQVQGLAATPPAAANFVKAADAVDFSAPDEPKDSNEPKDRQAQIRVALAALPAAVRAQFPAPLHEIVALGHARLRDYQDDAYAALYVQRLLQVLGAEQSAQASAHHGGQPLGATTAEAARWLALWMAFDDIVRVAALKLRPSRQARVRREVAARDDELVKVYDHFKPGVPEFAALLPAGLAHRLTAWDARRGARGLPAWALPMKIGSHTVLGALALRLVAGLKGQRRRGSRYTTEQALIERWLTALQAAAREDAALGLELARCGRLIKGYGSTNERGKHSLLHIVDHVAAAHAGNPDAAARAQAVSQVREAALADDAGLALDQALIDQGAPARPLREQPIRWFRREGPAAVSGRRSSGLK